MSNPKMTTSARVQVTVEVCLGTRWNDTCAASQIFEQAAQEAVLHVRRISQDRLHVVGAGGAHPHATYPVPAGHELSAIEEALASLSVDDMESFCCGDEEEQREISGRSEALTLANELLNDFFDNYVDSTNTWGVESKKVPPVTGVDAGA